MDPSNVYIDVQQYGSVDGQECRYTTQYPYDIIGRVNEYNVQVSRFSLPSANIPLVDIPESGSDYYVKMRSKVVYDFVERTVYLPSSRNLPIMTDNQYIEYINRALYRNYVLMMKDAYYGDPALTQIHTGTWTYSTATPGSQVYSFSLSGFIEALGLFGSIKISFNNMVYTDLGLFDIFIKAPDGSEHLVLRNVDFNGVTSFSLWDGYDRSFPAKLEQGCEYQPASNLNISLRDKVCDGPYQLLLYNKYAIPDVYSITMDVTVEVTQCLLNINYDDIVPDFANNTANLPPYLSIDSDRIRLNFDYNFYNSGVYIGCSESLRSVFNFNLDSDLYVNYDQQVIPRTPANYHDIIYMATPGNSVWALRSAVERIILRSGTLNTLKEYSDSYNVQSKTLTSYLVDPSTWTGKDYLSFNVNYSRYIEFLNDEGLRDLSLEIYYRFRNGTERILTIPKGSSWTITLQLIKKGLSV